MTPPSFAGPVQLGANYLLVDDHVGLGGTLANLRGHIELGGGTVVGMTSLTESRDGREISLRPETLDMLWKKHGKPLDQLWQEQFGYEIDCLTEVEAQNLCRQPSVGADREFPGSSSSRSTQPRSLRPADSDEAKALEGAG